MSKERDQKFQPEEGKIDSSATDADQIQPSQPNNHSRDGADDDFMRPFVSDNNDTTDAKHESDADKSEDDILAKTDEDSSAQVNETNEGENDSGNGEEPSPTQGEDPDENSVGDESAGKDSEDLEAEDSVRSETNESADTEDISEAETQDAEETIPFEHEIERENETATDEADLNEEDTIVMTPIAETNEEEEQAPAETDEKQMSKREQRRKDRKREKKKPGRIRLIPIWVRLVLLIAVLLGSAILGAMIGFGIIGDGGNPRDVLEEDTWFHIYDMIFDGTDRERQR
ncbi:DNA-directed RNA polymerase subunit beta [Salipaludibacillus sp. HK11]|uniref:DNA-directed RNA polymerase subunit beta n=1 Tax=Salipaludibacillus sp. HK11 TaxID=3394320 RepID=UPI0039FD160A